MPKAEGIVKFHLAPPEGKHNQPLPATLPPSVKERIHQCADLSPVYYAPSNAYTNLEVNWPDAYGKLDYLKAIPDHSVTIFHCGSYANRLDYKKEELNMKAIVLSKGYDIGICTGRSFVRYYCSDLMYVDRFFSYRFGDKKYWFVCYSNAADAPEIINDKFVELFGADRGPQVFAELQQAFELSKRGK